MRFQIRVRVALLAGFGFLYLLSLPLAQRYALRQLELCLLSFRVLSLEYACVSLLIDNDWSKASP